MKVNKVILLSISINIAQIQATAQTLKQYCQSVYHQQNIKLLTNGTYANCIGSDKDHAFRCCRFHYNPKSKERYWTNRNMCYYPGKQCTASDSVR